jgi:hypothetical protein
VAETGVPGKNHRPFHVSTCYKHASDVNNVYHSSPIVVPLSILTQPLHTSVLINLLAKDRRGRDRMVVGFTTTYLSYIVAETGVPGKNHRPIASH